MSKTQWSVQQWWSPKVWRQTWSTTTTHSPTRWRAGQVGWKIHNDTITTSVLCLCFIISDYQYSLMNLLETDMRLMFQESSTCTDTPGDELIGRTEMDPMGPSKGFAVFDFDGFHKNDWLSCVVRPYEIVKSWLPIQSCCKVLHWVWVQPSKDCKRTLSTTSSQHHMFSDIFGPSQFSHLFDIKI